MLGGCAWGDAFANIECEDGQYVETVQNMSRCKNYAKEGEVCDTGITASLNTGKTRCEAGLVCENGPSADPFGLPNKTCQKPKG